MRVTVPRMLGVGAALILATLTVTPARAIADEPSRLGQVGGRASAVGPGAGEPTIEVFETAGLAGDFRPVRLQGPAGAVFYEMDDPHAKDNRIKPLFLAKQVGPLSRTPSCGTDARRCEAENLAELVATRSLQVEAERSVRTALSQEEHLAGMPGVGRPGPLFNQVTAGEYRESVIGNLDYQRDHGIGVTGRSKVSVVSEPGDRHPGSDPRLTMRVCVDSSAMRFTDEGLEYYGHSSRGLLYSAVVDGRVKVVSAHMLRAASCN